MARKTLQEKINASLSKMEEHQKEHDKLIAQFNQKEEKDRVHRFCKRGGYAEKHLPELKTLTDEQFYTYFEKVMLTDEARLILMELNEENKKPAEPEAKTDTPQDGGTAAPKPTETAAQTDTPPAPKPTEAANSGGTGGNGNGGNHAGQNNHPPAQKNATAPHNGGTNGNHNGGNHPAHNNNHHKPKPTGTPHNNGAGGNGNGGNGAGATS